MNKGSIAKFVTRHGTEEIRIYFKEWPLDGKIVSGVTIFPHPCGTCVGGDHTHVDFNEIPEEIIRGNAVSLSVEEKRSVDEYLRAAEKLNDMTHGFEDHLRVCHGHHHG